MEKSLTEHILFYIADREKKKFYSKSVYLPDRTVSSKQERMRYKHPINSTMNVKSLFYTKIERKNVLYHTLYYTKNLFLQNENTNQKCRYVIDDFYPKY